MYFMRRLNRFGYFVLGSISNTWFCNSVLLHVAMEAVGGVFVACKRESNHGHHFAAMPKSNCRNDMEDSSHEICTEYSSVRYGFS